jgi:hypothetical protein
LISECSHMSMLLWCEASFEVQLPASVIMPSEIIKPIILIQFTIIQPYLLCGDWCIFPTDPNSQLNITILHFNFYQYK